MRLRLRSRMFSFVNRVDKVIWPPEKDASADVSRLRQSKYKRVRIHSLETSALESLYRRQITLSTLFTEDSFLRSGAGGGAGDLAGILRYSRPLAWPENLNKYLLLLGYNWVKHIVRRTLTNRRKKEKIPFS